MSTARLNCSQFIGQVVASASLTFPRLFSPQGRYERVLGSGNMQQILSCTSILRLVVVALERPRKSSDLFALSQADIQMHGFQNGLSTPVKLDNWQQLQKFFNKRDLRVPNSLVDDTMKVWRKAGSRFSASGDEED